MGWENTAQGVRDWVAASLRRQSWHGQSRGGAILFARDARRAGSLGAFRIGCAVLRPADNRGRARQRWRESNEWSVPRGVDFIIGLLSASLGSPWLPIVRPCCRFAFGQFPSEDAHDPFAANRPKEQVISSGLAGAARLGVGRGFSGRRLAPGGNHKNNSSQSIPSVGHGSTSAAHSP